MTLSDGEPEPDASVIRGKFEDYADHHPGPQDTPLVIEISDTTLSRDRGIKLRSYARAHIAAYWIVNLPERCVEVYTQPDSTNEPATYRGRRVYGEADAIDVMIDAVRIGAVKVSDLLP